MMLAEAAANLDVIARQLRDVARRVESRDDLEAYYAERHDIAAELGKIATGLEGEAVLARHVAAWLGDREERI